MAREFYCNKCGKKMDDFDIQLRATLDLRAEYGSEHDGEQIVLDLCCKCMDELIDSCVISPIEEV